MTMTENPRSARPSAINAPVTPAPITRTSHSSSRDIGSGTSPRPFRISQNACGDVRSIACRGGEAISQERANPPAVDSDRSAGDVARSLRGEERREGGKFARLPQSSHWNLFLPLGESAVGRSTCRSRQLLHAICPRVTGQQIVDRDSEWRDLVRQCPREADHGGAQTVGK